MAFYISLPINTEQLLRESGRFYATDLEIID
jgi:hypothetical protein